MRFERLLFATAALTASALAGCAAPVVEMNEAVLEQREQGNTGGLNYGEFGPADAFEDGSSHPFYGSENEWSRRMFSQRAADLYYKRRGQRQMLEIIDGNPAKAIELALARLADDSNDAESYYILAVANTQLGETALALDAVQAALDHGLPFERFVAGPRKLLATLVGSPEFAPLLAANPKQLLHGPMLGDITDSSVRVWVRTARETPFDVLVYGADGDVIATGSTVADSDYSGVAIVSGLQPATRYDYKLRFGAQDYPSDAYFSFTTAPIIGSRGVTTIGFGGCAGYTPANERMWDTIAGHGLQAFLFLGDNVYIDVPEIPGSIHEYTYYRRQSRPEFRRLVSETPVYAIWDDHDAAFDDIWLGPYVDRPAWKKPMINSFQQNWNNPPSGSEKYPGVWFKFSYGDVDVFMLDGRTYRSNPFIDSPSMLGDEQKAWLQNELKRSEAAFKLIASPVAWAEGAKPNSVDTWGGFPEEREELFTFIEQNDINGVVLVSSDRHRSEAWRIERESGYAFYDLLSGQLTNVHTHPVEDGALFSYNAKDSFGILRFDTMPADPTLTYSIYSIDNELIHTLSVRLSELSVQN